MMRKWCHYECDCVFILLIYFIAIASADALRCCYKCVNAFIFIYFPRVANDVDADDSTSTFDVPKKKKNMKFCVEQKIDYYALHRESIILFCRRVFCLRFMRFTEINNKLQAKDYKKKSVQWHR